MFAGLLLHNNDNTKSEKLLQLANNEDGLGGIIFDDSAHWQGQFQHSQLTLVQQRRRNTWQSHNEHGIITHVETNTQIIAWARIDNRKEVCEKLNLSTDTLTNNDTGLILAAYLKWGDKCCEHLVGDFSFVIIDHKNDTLFLARDHLGVRPLFYYQDEHCFAFATSMAVLNKIPNLNLTLDEQWISHYVSGFPKDWEMTAYQHIHKCPPAHNLIYRTKTLHHSRYFSFNPEPTLNLSSDEEYVEAYREQLYEAVKCRVNTSYPMASESSGGLDSSTITAIASLRLPHAGRHLHAFGYDEGELTGQYILDISKRFPIRETHFFSRTSERNPNVIDNFIQCYGAPSEHPNSISHDPIYMSCEKWGLRTLLSGFGGDEFVTTEAPVALVEFWKNRDFSTFLSRQRGNILTKPIHTSRWLFNYYYHKNQSISARGLMAMGALSQSMTPLSQELMAQYSIHENAEKYSRYDAKKTRQNDFALENRWSPVITARFENCLMMAAKYGIEYRWPLMDIRLLNLFLSIPASQKLGPRQVGRYLHRRAVNGLLPDDITWKEKSMRKLSNFQKAKYVITRRLTEYKLKDLSKSNLQQWQEAPSSNTTAKTSNERKQRHGFYALHPLLQDMLDKQKFDHLLDIIKNQDDKHEGQLLIAQAKMRNIRQLQKWLNQQLPVKSDTN